VGNFKVMTLELISQGNFITSANQDLAKLQREMIAFRKKYGDAAKKAKGTLTLSITIQADKDEMVYPVTANCKITMPTKPPMVSIAMANETGEGEVDLFVRNSGSSTAHPNQAVLTTADGREVDQETGEVIEPAQTIKLPAAAVG